MTAAATDIAALRSRVPDRVTLAYAAIVLNTELLAVLAYLWLVGPRVVRPLFYVYPFVWIDVALWAVWRVASARGDPGTTAIIGTSQRNRLIAGTLAVGYFLVLAYVGGLVAPGGRALGLRLVVVSLPPGWSPALIYGSELIQVVLLPFKVVGYLALAYLVYATVLDAAATAVGGLVGLFSCVSCTLPVVAGVVSGLVGGGGALVTAAYSQSYALSTAVFVATVALLVWRPTVADVSRLRRWLS